MEGHNQRVAAIASQIKKFHKTNVPFRIYHGSTNSTRPTVRQRNSAVDVSGLAHVLSIDVERKVAVVEPNVPMDALLREALGHGLVPPVVPEFPGITVGGGYSGTAGESSSFKYGFLDATVERLEVVLADGQVVEADAKTNPDLFYGTAGTLGTVGVVTLLHVQLIEAKKYVQLTFNPVDSFSAAVETMQEAVLPDAANDFVDGILFSATNGAIITGRMTDDANGTVVRFTRRRDPWYYLHAEEALAKSAGKIVQELVPLTDYLFRYDRGGFWVGRLAFHYFHLPFSRVLRWMFDKYLHTRAMYHALHESGLSEQYIIEDLAVPFPKAMEFLEYLDQDIKIYPLWLCPLKFGRMGISPKHMAPETHPLLLNVGVWGRGPNGAKGWLEANKSLESKVTELKGTKWLYAHMFYTEDEFWEIYDRPAYTSLRDRYNATQLPTVFDKVTRSSTKTERKGTWKRVKGKIIAFWVFPGLYGLWRTVSSKDYILKDDPQTVQGDKPLE
jgi:FAD/FMN-containing dehydrogenase